MGKYIPRVTISKKVFTCDCGCDTSLILWKFEYEKEDNYIYVIPTFSKTYKESLREIIENRKSGFLCELLLKNIEVEELKKYLEGYSSIEGWFEFESLGKEDSFVRLYSKKKVPIWKDYKRYEIEWVKHDS